MFLMINEKARGLLGVIVKFRLHPLAAANSSGANTKCFNSLKQQQQPYNTKHKLLMY
jgi:hypothetical protein